MKGGAQGPAFQDCTPNPSNSLRVLELSQTFTNFNKPLLPKKRTEQPWCTQIHAYAYSHTQIHTGDFLGFSRGNTGLSSTGAALSRGNTGGLSANVPGGRAVVLFVQLYSLCRACWFCFTSCAPFAGHAGSLTTCIPSAFAMAKRLFARK